VLEVGPDKCIVCLFMIEMTLDQTLGNWCQFIKLRGINPIASFDDPRSRNFFFA
jgi:hypothetical protein